MNISKVPILLIVFNRLDTLQRVIEPIRNYRPTQLFIAADGPRPIRQSDAEKCQAVRDWVLAAVNWPCEVKTRFRSENMGCGYGPADAITWFFSNVNEGVIIEDDIVASPAFFEYCGMMLERYRDNKRISIVSGCNFDEFGKTNLQNLPYFFSALAFTWGWATWRDRWEQYDYQIKKWRGLRKELTLRYLFQDKEYQAYWRYVLDNTARDIPDHIWDYQFFALCYMNRWLSVVPAHNMIENIGDGEDATHTRKLPEMRIGKQVDAYCEVPIQRNMEYDILLQERMYGRAEYITCYTKLKRKIKSIIKRL